jgi:hypothetical protein
MVGFSVSLFQKGLIYLSIDFLKGSRERKEGTG